MSLTEAQTDNMGGIQLIYPIAISLINNFDDIYSGKIHTFVLSNEINLVPLFTISDTIKFKQEKKSGADGTWYETKIEAEAPKDRIELQNFINTLEYEKYIVILKDNNDQYKVVGTPDEPLNIETEMDAGQVEGSLNGYRITFTRKLRERSPFADSLPTVALPD